jgi:glucokinase
MTDEVYIAVDLGGTRIRAARFTPELQMEQRVEGLTLADEGPQPVIRRIVEQARAVWPSDGRTVRAVGVSVPFSPSPDGNVITGGPNMPGWMQIQLHDLLREQLGTDIYIGNDANIAAIAEATMGAARGYRDVIFLTISTGIGSGVLVDGKLLVGSDGIGAECGLMILGDDGTRAYTLEDETAGPAIARHAREAIERGEQSTILEYAGGSVESITAKEVGQAATAGDPLARRLIERSGRLIGLGTLSLLHLFNPQIVVIGGGVAEGTGDLLLRPLQEAIKKDALDRAYWEHLAIVPATLGENVSLIGAAALALRKGT